ncbi:phenylacetate--CoA ligase family protein [Desulfofustis glycolicus]|uniref:Phenylacetate-CoA ligase n=1 Tax=Desulfofustis glycolicus DSM 9705 TaxID=1121409 RepID=A0A1M5YS90_9BACT|nr:phenylacetate--CoA ligase family protein [Desulfofustis glycolicus]SHI14720.1 phenylacetate-CoA ligase [Desulfofustis glycolicus DSM 9705]
MNFAFLRRHLFEPLHGRLTGSPKLAYWKDLEKNQYFSTQHLLGIQQRRLRELIAFVWENNSFYRERIAAVGLNPATMQNVTDLAGLPILTKSEIRDQMHNLLSRGLDQKTLQKAKTGGSTGTALELYFSEECSELRNACARRSDCWTGWRPGEPIAACWGNPKLPKTYRERLKFNLIQPYFYLDTMRVDEKAVRFFAEQWRNAKPTLLYGHAHSLYLLAEALQDLAISLPAPKGILSTSMMLIPSERAVIEEVFETKVTNRYGCEEVSLIGCECERHEGMHLNIEHLVIEFLRDDGTPASPGEPGRIVVTDLINWVMPLIRYQVEDVGVPSLSVCSCGRGLPLMDQVIGRVADFLIKLDGSRVAGISLIENTLTDIPGIRQMQIIQEAIDEIKLNIVPANNYTQETYDQLLSYFQDLFGDAVRYTIKKVTDIKAEPSGKYRFSICNVK